MAINDDNAKSNWIEQTLSSRVRIRILVFLAVNHGTGFSKYKISSATNISAKEVSKHMKILVEAKLVRAVGGGVTLYSFNESGPALLFAEFLRRSIS
ncbi:MAG: winged helix-turn-helix domain-containing protein [Nitrososphaera sp.]